MRTLGAVVASVALAVTAALVPAPAQATQQPFAPDGVLYFPSVAGLLPALKAPHFCSASVVHSAGKDLVVTAAHCVYGIGLTLEFAPGFHDGTTPYGVWTVKRIYVQKAWQAGQSPAADVAFLQIAPLHGRSLEDVVGARPLGMPTSGHDVTVSGFPATSNTPTICTSPLYLTAGYPSVTCAGGIINGVSGGAWIQQDSVVGVVGGLDQGGCSDTVGYSTPFDAGVQALWNRAQAGGPGDFVLPGFFANSCS